MLSILTAEFKWKSFSLDHSEPELFLVSKWQRSFTSVSDWYIIYRWFWAVYHVSWSIACFLTEGGLESPLERKAFYFIYLTQWSYLVMTTMNVLWAVLVTRARSRHNTYNYLVKTMGVPLKILWVLLNISFLAACLITVVYWLAVYDPAYPIGATNVETHICNSAYVFIDLTISAVPIRIMHFYQPIIYLLLYLSFNVIYFIFGGLTPEGETAIYPIMDWQNLSITVPFMLITLMITVIVQAFLWVIYICTKSLSGLVVSAASGRVDGHQTDAGYNKQPSSTSTTPALHV